MRSTVDEIGGIAPFYNDPSDYYDALNQGYRVVVAELAMGEDAQINRLPGLVTMETLTDSGGGVSLATRCYLPLSVEKTGSPRHHVTIKDYANWLSYSNVTRNGFLQATVKGDKLFTAPANKQVDFYYLKYPQTLDATHDPEIDEVFHADIWQNAIQFLLRKDINSTTTQMIESWRDRRELYRSNRKKKTEGFEPKQIPYQQQK